MDVLTVSPYELTYDELIVARVSAVNSFGSSDWSMPNIGGAKIRSVPF